MEISEIGMDKLTAREHFLRYRNLVRQRRVKERTKEDLALMRGFKALSMGKQVIDLFATMKKVGLDERMRPKLAICQANALRVYYRHGDNGAGAFSIDTDFWRQRHRGRISFAEGTFSTATVGATRWRSLTALVPGVPAQLRPAALLSNYHILWEPEWEEEPPRDPILLKRIARYVFVVLAQWELSELERSMLRGVV